MLHNRDEITITLIYIKNLLILGASAASDSCDGIKGFRGVDI
jgi:hypothetical protein